METNERPSFFERMNNWLKNSITVRITVVGVLILLMLIPVSMIQDLIRERKYRHSDAIEEVSEKWGREQTIKGPLLTVPYRTKVKVYDEDAKVYKMEYNSNPSYANFLPEQLSIDGVLSPEKLHRGIYEVVVYGTDLKVSGKFNAPDFSEWRIDPQDILWEDAYLAVGITDLRGVQENIELKWGTERFPFDPGVESIGVISQGVSANLGLTDSIKGDIAFDFNLTFNGSEGVHFTPMGRTTTVNIQSDWTAPSFNGAHLPDHREITKEGFVASWKVLHLNRPYPQQFLGGRQDINPSAFGVDLKVEADEYQKSTRSAKYAVLFITLTFLIFFFVQVMNKIRIHPIQYIIVGLSLCLFYTLLISLSEHISFAAAYWIASAGVIGMISFYARGFLHDKKTTWIITGILTVLYLFIFTVIQQTDYALLTGSVGLFVAMAVVVILSRRIDWYALSGARVSPESELLDE